MFKLGLTGSIATGKSTALAAFAALGHPVFSADEAVHLLYRGEAVTPVERAFPEAVAGGKIDRAILLKLLMAAPQRIEELNKIVHPLVRAKIADFVEKSAAAPAKLAVIDVPLLFETGVDYGFDAVAVTFCDEQIQRRRALARPDMDVEKLNTILARQMSQSEKKQRADFLIDTNGTIEETNDQVAAIASLCIE